MNAVPFHRKIGFRIVLGLVLWGAAYALLHVEPNAPRSLPSILGDIALLLFSLLLTIALTAQFVLPVRDGSERLAVILRLLEYLAGRRGPVTFIQNGKAVEAGQERERRDKGVLLIDYASAAVLRTKTRFTRAMGPGVVFTARQEHLAEALNLQRHVRSLRGRVVLPEEASPDQGIAAQGLSQDGIPVSADLSVTFLLDPGHAGWPREGRHAHLPPYEFNAASAEKAVYGHTYSEQEDLPWTELPLRLVADLWREELKNWRLKALLDPGKDQPAPLQRIQAAILARLTAPQGKAPEEGQEEAEESREYEVLRSRGIRVLDVLVTNLCLPPNVQKTHLENWRQAWAGEAQTALGEARQEADNAYGSGVRQAQEMLAVELTARLRAQLARGEKPPLRDTLALLLGDAIRLCYEGEPVSDAAVIATHLSGIADTLQQLDAQCKPAAAGEDA